ncbi:MAG: HD domain-containing phosphohydrolase [Pseudomonadota bacterium]
MMETIASGKNAGVSEGNRQRAVRILIVDDEGAVRRLLGRLLELDGYECTLAKDAREARAEIGAQDFELVLCDVNMPGESGTEFGQYVLKTYPDTAVVMVTAVDDPKIAERAIDIGAYGYVIKPFKASELKINVGNALRRRRLEIDNRAYRQNLERVVGERTAELQETLKKLQTAMEGIIQAMAQMGETRDPYTAGHQRRVAGLACAIACEMGLSGGRLEGLRMAGIIHDLGKISVPAEILSKPAVLSQAEFKLLEQHPEVAYHILKDFDFPWPIAYIVYQHHERLDGSGYPNGISGAEILLEAKILAVADVVEAMASHRPYRPSLGVQAALKEITRQVRVLFDPEAVSACLRLFREKGFHLGPKAEKGAGFRHPLSPTYGKSRVKRFPARPM